MCGHSAATIAAGVEPAVGSSADVSAKEASLLPASEIEAGTPVSVAWTNSPPSLHAAYGGSRNDAVRPADFYLLQRTSPRTTTSRLNFYRSGESKESAERRLHRASPRPTRIHLLRVVPVLRSSPVARL